MRRTAGSFDAARRQVRIRNHSLSGGRCTAKRGRQRQAPRREAANAEKSSQPIIPLSLWERVWVRVFGLRASLHPRQGVVFVRLDVEQLVQAGDDEHLV